MEAVRGICYCTTPRSGLRSNGNRSNIDIQSVSNVPEKTLKGFLISVYIYILRVFIYIYIYTYT